MTTKIDTKITGFSVVKKGGEEAPIIKHEHPPLLNRDEILDGSTYKIKPPGIDQAYYITINNSILEEGTENETVVPFEIFINTKNAEHFMWITALTRIISAVFRKGEDASFLVEELRAVFDPRGGYYKKGGLYCPSLVADIGMVLEIHLKRIGVIEDEEVELMTTDEKADKIKELKRTGIPANATTCNKCQQKAVVRLDNCNTCLECGDAKCG